MSHCEKVDGIQQPDKETEGYVFNHMMLRIKDPKRSLDFYSKVMGMRMVKKLDFPSMKFSLYFLGYQDFYLKFFHFPHKVQLLRWYFQGN